MKKTIAPVGQVQGSAASKAVLPEKLIVSSIIGGIVELFTNNVTTRNGEQYNTHQYSLINALNGIAFNASRQKEYVETQLEKARDEAKKALMAASGNEISINNVRYATERLDQREDELACIELLLDQSVKAYEAFSDKKFEYKGKPTVTPVKNVATENVDVQALARRLGVDLDHVTNNTNGVETQL